MNIREGYKITYHGSVAKSNGVGIIIAEILQDKIVDIQWKMSH